MGPRHITDESVPVKEMYQGKVAWDGVSRYLILWITPKPRLPTHGHMSPMQVASAIWPFLELAPLIPRATSGSDRYCS